MRLLSINVTPLVVLVLAFLLGCLTCGFALGLR
ncbi:hypothetical protein Pan14r_51800 [Crateriforma conspicua]|uniref:Uncharacterized protein n=1 Tax=Crateriforma conspicua TaxID=2527996 RepID=A0A5C5XTH0_9PLAN|nr:hypothetical protein Pan14r_51800 [Crateriforma conspicua]